MTFEVKKGEYSSTGTVEYRLDSLSTRAEKAEKVVQKVLADFKPGRAIDEVYNQTADEYILDPRVQRAFLKEKNGIAIYEDISVTVNGMVKITILNPSNRDDKKDKAMVTVPLAVYNGKEENNVNDHTNPYYKNVTKYYTIDSAADRVKAATKAVQKYLPVAKDLPSDVTTDVDGEAEVTFKLQAVYNTTDAKFWPNKNGTFTRRGTFERKEGDEVTDFTITLPSDQTKADMAAAELKYLINRVAVTADMDEDDYKKELTCALESFYIPKYTDYHMLIGKIPLDENSWEFDDILKDVYGDGMKVSLTFGDNDATSAKGGAKKATITVSYGNAAPVVVEKIYTRNTYAGTDSVQADIDKAKAAVEAALDAMTFTKDTEKEDVEAVVAEALKEYPGVESAVTYVADKKTANVGVALTKTVNGVTGNASIEKSYAISSGRFVEQDGKKYFYDANGELVKNRYIQADESGDGFTYFAQNDGSVMQDRLSYDPSGKDVIYFDADGHMAFDKFINIKHDVLGNPVDYIGYFDTFGRAYVNRTTYGNGEGAYAKDALFYINDYGVLENKGWFKNAAGEIGYAATNGTLTTSQWSLDPFGRRVYFQANGFLAKGTITDGVKYYQLDENDGHLVGEF